MTVPGGGAPPRRRVRDMFQRRLGRRLRAPFPEVPGNEVIALSRGEDYYEAMAASIDGAERSVDVEMYLWDADEVGRGFVDRLVAAARRGLRVRVLADAQGARAALCLLGGISVAGGDVRVFNPFLWKWIRRYLHRTHKKLLLVDGRVAWTGGAGFSLDFSLGRGRERPWLDRMFRIRGPVVSHLEVVFETDFGRWAGQAPRRAPEGDVTAPILAPPPAAGPSTLRVLRGWPDAREFRPLLLQAIRGAKRRVWIGTPYFLPPHSVRRAMYDAAERGADVRVVIPSLEHAHPLLYHATRARYGRWLSKGVRLYEFLPGFYHAKVLVADDALALIGSSNLDSWSWRRNAELDLQVTDEPTVDALAQLHVADRENSHEVTKEDARVRSFLASVKQTTASWFEDWL